MASGIPVPGYTSPRTKPAGPSPVQSAYDTAGATAAQQGVDYGDIMGRYRDLYDSFGAGAGKGGATADFNYNYTVPTYQTTSDYRNAITNLADLSKTGGYSGSDIANIRERGISPIRSVYQNAQTNLNRQKSLQGGYSPNYGAVSAKMAREMSSQLSDATTNVNAQIAQNVAQNRIATSVPYGSLTAGEQSDRNKFSLSAAEMANRFGLDKLQSQIQQYEFPIQSRLSALGGMTGLFGTRPGFASMQGDQAFNLAQLQDKINQENKTRGLSMIGPYAGA